MQINVSQIQGYISQAITIALIVVFAVTILQHFGVNIPMVKSMTPLQLLYFTAAWAMLTGRVKLG